MTAAIKYLDIKDLIQAQHGTLRFLLKEIENLIEQEQDYQGLLSQLIAEFDCLLQAERRTLIRACYHLNRLVPEVEDVVEDSAIIQILVADMKSHAENTENRTSSDMRSAQKLRVLLQLIEKLLSQKEEKILNLVRETFSYKQMFDMGVIFRRELLLRRSPSVLHQ
ncbi:hypothetical protein [Pseudobdellovibrio exovorus]|uniref:Uncharacterized protein n=1 Tax=Pseudobdellovibrio exovorus JSS TaxID=1184267 RepID=M4V987_9BACT|nr:hypothetical protein [Pseudobdellovibrio exovorus]AGH94581.1 hypothetical protein A11Q_361 [Pseudobdellovibrio exovorus JSS]